MRKIFVNFIYVVLLSLLIENNVYANSKVNNKNPLQAIFKGRALLVDMDANDIVSKTTFLQGKDLILVKIIPMLTKKKDEPLHFQIVAFSKPEDLTKIDLNHDGMITKDEMAKANVAFLRYNDSGDILVNPLADSLIKQVNYIKNKDGSLIITLIANDNKKFNGYFIDF